MAHYSGFLNKRTGNFRLELLHHLCSILQGNHDIYLESSEEGRDLLLKTLFLHVKHNKYHNSIYNIGPLSVSADEFHNTKKAILNNLKSILP